VRNAKDITFAKEIIKKHNNHAQLIAKVETQLAVDNLDEILTQVDSILVDRGDLSADIGIHKLADYQEEIINAAKNKGKKIYLATQFLRNMEKNPLPLIAETIDLYKTIRSGINGIQLSEETAIGAYPVQCVEYIFEAFKGISRKKSQNRTIDNT
jgi:pyruvate kinase